MSQFELRNLVRLWDNLISESVSYVISAQEQGGRRAFSACSSCFCFLDWNVMTSISFSAILQADYTSSWIRNPPREDFYPLWTELSRELEEVITRRGKATRPRKEVRSWSDWKIAFISSKEWKEATTKQPVSVLLPEPTPSPVVLTTFRLATGPERKSDLTITRTHGIGKWRRTSRSGIATDFPHYLESKHDFDATDSEHLTWLWTSLIFSSRHTEFVHLTNCNYAVTELMNVDCVYDNLVINPLARVRVFLPVLADACTV